MEHKQLFKKYRSRLIGQGIIKSVLYGLIVGFAVNFVAALVAWFVGYDGTWLSVGVGVAAMLVSGLIFYFVKFHPSSEDVARQVDALGLKERMVTMVELSEEQSYIAKIQREDAKAKLATVTPKQIKLRIAKKVIAYVAAAAVVAPAMTVICELAARNVLQSGLELLDPNSGAIKTISITFEAEDGGSIDGKEVQVLYVGEKTEPVKAMADDGWMFVEWSDGNGDPYRPAEEFEEDTVYTAIFEEVDPTGEGDGDGEGSGEGEGQGEGQGEGDAAGDQPGEPNGDGDGDGKSDQSNDKPTDKESNSAGGQYDPKNQIIDGRTFYEAVLETYFEAAMEMIANGQELPPELADIVEKYFGSI
ncbi:MAG: hypothetical protein IJX81_00305 [Clostridia bacterium]|nr:hypothetical protein [Clostridia bacterium]